MRRPTLAFYIAFFFLMWYFSLLTYFLLLVLPLSVGFHLLFRYVCDNFLSRIPEKSAILITGCSTGFGKAFTYDLAQKDILVFAGVRKDSDGEALIKECPEKHRKLIQPVILDVTKTQQVESAFKKVQEVLAKENRQLYAIVNNAGTVFLAPVEDTKEEDFTNIFDIHVFGMFRVTKAFLPLLRECKTGSPRVVSISSVAANCVIPFLSGYSGAKAAQEVFSDCLRSELKLFNIQVSTIHSGGYATPIVGKEDVMQKQMQNTDSVYTKFFNYFYSKKWKETMSTWPEDITPVTKCLNSCLFSYFPPARVFVGTDAIIFGYINNLLPESIRTPFALAVFGIGKDLISK